MPANGGWDLIRRLKVKDICEIQISVARRLIALDTDGYQQGKEKLSHDPVNAPVVARIVWENSRMVV